MRYEGIVYRPPSEAGSLIIQATIGCPHNQCTFCSMYKGTKFRIRPVEDIKQDLDSAYACYGEKVESIFFPDGNTIVMKTDDLAEIFEYAGELFPYLKRITIYGSARFVNKKSAADLVRLHRAGLKRIHTGMETGDDITLQRIKKGVDSRGLIEAGLKLKEAGITVSEYYLVGIAGRERSAFHAVNSGKVLSSFSPDYIRLRTYVPVPGTPLYDEFQNGTFELPSPHEALKEIALLIENLNCTGSILLSDHVSNYCNINGQLPADREKMLEVLDHALTIDESMYFQADPYHL
ncbi:MAG TPA: radical SAM protein [Syntrophomonadaceae bacterium]|nr:radical SAM protein [Syntrophomonadaceae bacterium]